MEALEKLMVEDQRAISLSWENFNCSLQEFHVACKFHEWKRAEEVRNQLVAHVEAAADSFMRLHRRSELLGR